MSGAPNKSTKTAIVLAKMDLLRSLPKLDVMDVEMDVRSIKILADICWACGAEEASTFGAHVVPHSRGGPDSPDNYFLLCCVCLDEQPEGLSRDVQVDWLTQREHWIARRHRLAKQFVDELRQEGVTAERMAHLTDSGLIEQWTHDGFELSGSWLVSSARANAFLKLKTQVRKHLATHQRRTWARCSPRAVSPRV